MQETKWDAVLDLIDEIILKIHTNGEIIFLSNAWLEHTGFPIEQSLKKNISYFLSKEDKKLFQERLASPYISSFFESNIKIETANKQSKLFLLKAQFDRNENLWNLCLKYEQYLSQKIQDSSNASNLIIEMFEGEQGETLYESVITSLVEGIVIQAQSGKILTCNQAAERILGLTLSEMKGQNSINPLWRTIQEDGSDFPSDLHPSSITLKTGEPQRDVIMGVHKPDDSLSWISINSQAIYLENQTEPEGVVTSFQDITSIKEDNKKLERLARVSRETLNAVIITDKNGMIEWVNKGFERVSGYTLEEVKGQKPGSFLQGVATKPQTVAKIRKAIDCKEHIRVAIENYHKNGTTYWIDLHIQPILDEKGNVREFFSIQSDITEKKNLEKRFKVIFEATSTAFIIVNQQGIIQLLNKQAEQLFHYTRQELSGKNINELIPFNFRDHHEHLVQKYFTNPEARQMAHNRELEAINKHGDRFPVTVNLNYMKVGNQTLALASINDLSESKKKAYHLEKLTEDLMNRNESLEHFNYVVSHNIRGHIANLLGLTNIFLPDAPEDPINNRVIQEVAKVANNLDIVINDLNNILEFQQDLSQQYGRIYLEELTNEVLLTDLKEEINQIKTFIESDFTQKPSLVSVRSYLQSIFLNILSNAIKYRSPERALHIKINSQIEGDFVRIGFSDNGIGINLERYRDRIFQFYQRAHIHVPGKGLGLYLVKTQVETLGGKIEVESEEEKGTTFYIYLPDSH